MRIALTRDGRIAAQFDKAERAMIADLTGELVDLLHERDTSAAGGALPRDPAVERLLPDAYRDDTDAAAEFRRLTEADLADLKTENAMTLAHAAASNGPVLLDGETVVPWLRAITDLRLALATRLGIERDEDEGDPSPQAAPAKAAYWWLGELQERLLRALDD